jgi:hypothetical protein
MTRINAITQNKIRLHFERGEKACNQEREEAATKTARRAEGRMNEAKSKPKEKARQKAKRGSY